MAQVYKIKIFNKEYNIQTAESEEYTQRLADTLNKKLSEIVQGMSNMTPLDGAVLVALDCLDRSLKADIDIDKIRGQIKEYVDDAANSAEKLRSANEEISKLTAKIAKLEDELSEANRLLNRQGLSLQGVKQKSNPDYERYTKNVNEPKGDKTTFVPNKNGQTSFFNK